MFSKVPQELTFTATLSKSNLVHQWASSPTIRIKNAISRISHTILLLSETTNEQRRLNYRYYPQNRPIIYERKSHYSNVKLESLREPCNSKEKNLNQSWIHHYTFRWLDSLAIHSLAFNLCITVDRYRISTIILQIANYSNLSINMSHTHTQSLFNIKYPYLVFNLAKQMCKVLIYNVWQHMKSISPCPD